MTTDNAKHENPISQKAIIVGLSATSLFMGASLALINVFGASTFVAYLEGAAFICM